MHVCVNMLWKMPGNMPGQCLLLTVLSAVRCFGATEKEVPENDEPEQPHAVSFPLKSANVMAKGRQLQASTYLASIQCKLLSLWEPKRVSMRYSNSTISVWRCTQLQCSIWLASFSCKSFLLCLLFFFLSSCVLLYLCWRHFSEIKERKLWCPWLWEK